MTIWAFVVILAVVAYANRKPRRVIRYQPREVPIERRRPSPWLQADSWPTVKVLTGSPVASSTRPSKTQTIEDQWKPGCARIAERTALAKHVGAVDAETVPRTVTGGFRSNSKVTANSTVIASPYAPDLIVALRNLGFSARSARQEIDTGSSLARAIARSLTHG